jgi:type II secretory pathway pseudopilin PulG
LIELIVVMAILIMVLVLTATISSRAIDMRSATKARIVAGRNAAAFLRQFEADLAQRITRREARAHFDKQAGNDEISLLTQRPGYSIANAAADRRAALVSYRVERQALERAAGGYGFGDIGARPDETAGTLALAQVPAEGPQPSADRFYQVIAPGLIRLEFAFLVREGKSRVVRAEPPRDQQRIEAVVATVVTLDPDRCRMLDEGQYRVITAEFPDAVDGELPGEDWTRIAASLARKMPTALRPATRQVRVYQAVVPWPKHDLLP